MKRCLLLSLLIHIIIIVLSFDREFTVPQSGSLESDQVKVRIINFKSSEKKEDVSFKLKKNKTIEKKKKVKKLNIEKKSKKTINEENSIRKNKRPLSKKIDEKKEEKILKKDIKEIMIKEKTIKNRNKSHKIPFPIEIKELVNVKKKNFNKIEEEKSIKKVEDKIKSDRPKEIKSKEKSLKKELDKEIKNEKYNKNKSSSKNYMKKLEDGSILITAADKVGIKYKIIESKKPIYPKQAQRVKLKKNILIKSSFIVDEKGEILIVSIESDYKNYKKLGFYSEVKKVIKSYQILPQYYKGKKVKVLVNKKFFFKSPYE